MRVVDKLDLRAWASRPGLDRPLQGAVPLVFRQALTTGQQDCSLAIPVNYRSTLTSSVLKIKL